MRPLLTILTLAACVGGEGADDTGTTDQVARCVAGETFTTEGSTTTLAKDGLQIVAVSLGLTEQGFQSFTADTCDWVFGDNLLNVFETDIDYVENGWDEEHVLPSTRFTDGDEATPRSDHLELAMDHVDTIGELTGTTKTLFNSADAGRLTFSLRVYGSDAALQDCVVWGHDTDALFAGEVPDNNYPGPTELQEVTPASCRVLSL